MGSRILKELDWKLFMLVLMIFFFSSSDALAQKKGDFVKRDQLIDYSIALARKSHDYKPHSHTITPIE